MRKSKKRQLYTTIPVLVLAAFSILVLVFFFSSQKQEGDMGEISKTDLKYKTAYFKQTKYKNELFYVVADSENINDNSHDVTFCLSSSGIKEEDVISPYENKINTVISVNLDETTYKQLINGYDAFTADLTVTTVIIPGESGSFSYGYCYIDEEDGKTLAEKALIDLNNGIEDGSYSGTKLTTNYAISGLEKLSF